jgi:hypothetical protein
MPLRLAKGFNHEDRKDTKAVTKDVELDQAYESSLYFLGESFVLFVPMWLNKLPPHSDPKTGVRNYLTVASQPTRPDSTQSWKAAWARSRSMRNRLTTTSSSVIASAARLSDCRLAAASGGSSL